VNGRKLRKGKLGTCSMAAPHDTPGCTPKSHAVWCGPEEPERRDDQPRPPGPVEVRPGPISRQRGVCPFCVGLPPELSAEHAER